MNNNKFDGCNHTWELLVDIDKAGGPASGNTIFMCKNCKHFISLKEKAALETVELTRASLKDQERSLENAKIATYVAAGALCLTAIIFILETILK